MVFDGLPISMERAGTDNGYHHMPRPKALTQIDHDVLIAEEEHAGARVVQLVPVQSVGMN